MNHLQRLENPKSVESKDAALRCALSELPSLIVAYSGGVDSAFLAWAATPFVFVAFAYLIGFIFPGFQNVVALIGFFLLPTTTLAYAIALNETGGLRSWGLILVVFAVLIDLGITEMRFQAGARQ